MTLSAKAVDKVFGNISPNNSKIIISILTVTSSEKKLVKMSVPTDVYAIFTKLFPTRIEIKKRSGFSRYRNNWFEFFLF